MYNNNLFDKANIFPKLTTVMKEGKTKSLARPE